MSDKNKKTSTKKPVNSTSSRENKNFTLYFWIFSLFPFLIVTSLFLFQSEDDLPKVELLDNPPEIQASLIIAKKSEKEDTVIGRFWLVNRTSIKYRQISPFVIDALIATEDERFMNHSGVDFKGLVRSIFSLGSRGGASTIPQQLAKLLFTLQKRQEEEIARAKGETLAARVGGFFGKFRRVNEKIQENIIAKRLEERYTKEEIITMYLNQFDFLYNAVGIENAARVYFNKTPINLTKTEAAMLVGMCKNPDLYNPYSYQVDNYKRKIANYKEIPLNQVTQVEIYERRSKDSIRAVERRNQVLYQWLKNSEDENDALQTKITREEYDNLKTSPVTTKFTSLDHKEGMAPYFRESMRSEVKGILEEKNEDGKLKYLKEDGTPYNIYRDGLKIYTTLNPTLQRHAEYAVERHIKEDMQPAFDQNNKSLKNYPFANSVSPQMIERIMENARRSTDRYRKLIEAGASGSDIKRNFETPCAMRVFSWRGERDTTMSPNDSIRYYKAFLHAGLVSIDPQTGFVKAWVGGVNFKHFSYDHVRLGKRQVGSTIKPFVYATALEAGSVKPCTTFNSEDYAVETLNEDGSVRSRYRPSGQGAKNVRDGLALSSNPTTAAVMQKIGSFNPYSKSGGPYAVEKLLKKVNITLSANDVVPSMALGAMDLSLFQMVSAQCIFANNGIYYKPTTIERITDRNGKVIYSADAKISPFLALNQTAAYEVLKMMKGGIAYGTGSSLRSGKPWGGITAPTAGKTGTTQRNSDAWFMGLTPKLVTGVWVGAEDRVVRFRSTAMGQGARAALPIYGYFMQRAYRDRIFNTFEDFRQPYDYDPTKFDCSESTDTTPPDEIEVPFEF